MKLLTVFHACASEFHGQPRAANGPAAGPECASPSRFRQRDSKRTIPIRLILLLVSAVAALGQARIDADSPPLVLPLVASRYVIDAVTACGVVGDKTRDDTRAINYCIRSAPDNSTIWFRPTLKMKITGTINWLNKHNLAIVGSPGAVWQGPSASDTNAAFFWYGPADGTMMYLDGADSFYIANLSFFSSPGFTSGTGGASTGISIDQAKGATIVTTNGIVDKVSVIGTQQNPSFRAIVFANTGGRNVEHMEVKDSNISCSYTGSYRTAVGQGIVIGPTQNGQNQLFEGNSIGNCGTGIYNAWGAIFYAIRNQFNQNGVHIYGGTPYAPLHIENNDSENSFQFYKGGGEVIFTANRIAAEAPPSGVGAIECTSGCQAILIGNEFDHGSYIPVSLDAGLGGSAYAIGNAWPNASLAMQGLATFGYGSLSILDETGGGALSLFTTSGTAGNPTPTAGIGQLNYRNACVENACSKWMANEGSGPWLYLIPDVTSTRPTCDTIGRTWYDTTTSTTVMKVCMSVSGRLTWVAK